MGNVREAQKAVDDGLVDYVGIGAVWQTTSKDVSGKIMLGPAGVGEILDVLAQSPNRSIKSVAIGESNPVSHACLQRLADHAAGGVQTR